MYLKTTAGVLGLAMLAGCGTGTGERALSGGALGAGAGAATGAVVGGGAAEGAAIGGALGAATGALTEPDDVYLGDPVWDDFDAW